MLKAISQNYFIVMVIFESEISFQTLVKVTFTWSADLIVMIC